MFTFGAPCPTLAFLYGTGAECDLFKLDVHFRRAMPHTLGPGDRRFEEEMIDLGVALGLPDVGPPDVGAMIPDQDAAGLSEMRLVDLLFNLLEELRLPCGIPDHRHRMMVGIRQSPDPFQHLQALKDHMV